MTRRSPALLFLGFIACATAPASVSAQAPAPSSPRLTSRGYVTWIYAHPRTTERFVGYVQPDQNLVGDRGFGDQIGQQQAGINWTINGDAVGDHRRRLSGVSSP